MEDRHEIIGEARDYYLKSAFIDEYKYKTDPLYRAVMVQQEINFLSGVEYALDLKETNHE